MSVSATTATARPERFAMPEDGEAARLVSLIRAIVSCAEGHGPVRCGEIGPIGAVVRYLKTIDRGARRRLTLGSGDGATADELALVHLLVDAQTGESGAADARLAWLVRASAHEAARTAAAMAAEALAAAGVEFAPLAPRKAAVSAPSARPNLRATSRA